MKYTNNYGLPQSIFDAIVNDTYDGPKDIKSISVTTLINPPKIRILKLRHAHEITEDISDNIWRLLGSSTHSVLERVDDQGRFIEERINVMIGNKTLSGKPDIYESKDFCVQDYKVTSVWSVVYSPEGKKEWENQLNCLAWLFRQSGFEVKKLRIIAILRDWSKTEAKKNTAYPQIPIVVIDIPLWPSDQQFVYIVERLEAHSLVELLEDDDIPECSPEDRWASSDTYAVYKNTNKRADKVCMSETEAIEYISMQDQKHTWRLEKRPGVDKRCVDYCSVNKWCHYWKAKYGSREMSDMSEAVQEASN